jgi:hypothetical protein
MAKRANGEGSVFKRSDGTWSAALSYRDADGRTRRHTVYGRTQAEVRAKLRVAHERRDAGAPVKDATTTFGAWLEDWITRRCRPATASRRLSTCTRGSREPTSSLPSVRGPSTGSAPPTSRRSSSPNGGPVCPIRPSGPCTRCSAPRSTSPSAMGC